MTKDKVIEFTFLYLHGFIIGVRYDIKYVLASDGHLSHACHSYTRHYDIHQGKRGKDDENA